MFSGSCCSITTAFCRQWLFWNVKVLDRGSFFPFGDQQKLLLGKLPRFFSTQCFSSHSSVWHASNESLVSHPAEWTSQTEVKEGLVKEIPQLREHLFDQRLSSETHSWSAFTGGWICKWGQQGHYVTCPFGVHNLMHMKGCFSIDWGIYFNHQHFFFFFFFALGLVISICPSLVSPFPSGFISMTLPPCLMRIHDRVAGVWQPWGWSPYRSWLPIVKAPGCPQAPNLHIADQLFLYEFVTFNSQCSPS